MALDKSITNTSSWAWQDRYMGIENRLYTGHPWYRFSDAVRLNLSAAKNLYARMFPEAMAKAMCNHDLCKVITTIRRDYKHSLANAYFESGSKAPGAHVNCTLLNALIDRDHRQTCVVHLRVGEVLDAARSGTDGLTTAVVRRNLTLAFESGIYAQSGRLYALALSHYRNALPRLRRLHIRKVVIIAGVNGAFARGYCNSAAYVDAVRRIFAEAGIDVRLRLGGHPDDDLELMARARCLMPAGGGFAELGATLASLRGGVVLPAPPRVDKLPGVDVRGVANVRI